MKNQKHTPGPWTPIIHKGKSTKHDFGIDFIQVTMPNGGDSGCDISRSGKSFEESAANARLIAAAPEMLEALELMQSNNRLMNALNTSKDRHILDAIQNAIKKARGES